MSVYIFFGWIGWIENKIIGEITHNDTFYEHWDQQKITIMEEKYIFCGRDLIYQNKYEYTILPLEIKI